MRSGLSGLGLLAVMLSAGALPLPAQELRAVGQLRSSGPLSTEASKKIVSRLRALIAEFGAAGITRDNAAAMSAAARFSSATLKVDDAGRVQVNVTLADTGEATLATLHRHGLDIEILNRDLAIVQGWIPVENLEGLAGEPVVLKIRPPSYATPRTGSVDTQGDTIHRCDQVRSPPGLTGAGVKVGVISDGVDGLAASQGSGDLAAVRVLAAGSGDEGTAILEIIHDCAPGAVLAFSTGFPTSMAFINSVNALKNAGAKIIVDDVGFFGEPFFQDGAVALNDRAVGSAVLRVSAGGNDALHHYQGTFTPGPFDNEIPGTRHVFGGGDSLLRFRVAGGESGTVILQWANPFGAAGDDYDLCVRQTSGVILGCSADIQDGNDDPIEGLTVSCGAPAGSACAADIQITLFAGSPRLLSMFCVGACVFDEFNVPAGSIIEHPSVPEVVAVAAASASTPTVIESYSSRGPTTILFPAAESRPKPDVTGIDCVTTSRPGFSPFCGTSAAAPHVAAVAALALEADATLSPLELRGLLKGTAIDLGPVGFDAAFGFGRADAVDGVAVAAAGPVAPTLTLSLNGTTFHTGSTTVVTATLTPGTLSSNVDAYVVVRLPNGSLFSLQFGGPPVPGIVPIARGFVPFAVTAELVRYPFGGTEPVGNYAWFATLGEAGTTNVLGGIDQDPFTFSP
jgi:subtilisin family serine protease